MKIKTEHDSRKSFYGKALIETDEDVIILRSYSTSVAEIRNGIPRVFGSYSLTTMRHIKEFLKQNGFLVESTKQVLNDYGVKR